MRRVRNPPTQSNDCGKHIDGYLFAGPATQAISKGRKFKEFKVYERSIGVHSLFNTGLLVVCYTAMRLGFRPPF